MLKAIALTSAAAACLLAVTAGPAQAQAVCGTKAVRAAGGPAILETAARSRARSAWIKKVSASRKLGQPYAVWLRAKSPAYTCRKAGRHYTCEAAAIPCRT